MSKRGRKPMSEKEPIKFPEDIMEGVTKAEDLVIEKTMVDIKVTNGDDESNDVKLNVDLPKVESLSDDEFKKAATAIVANKELIITEDEKDKIKKSLEEHKKETVVSMFVPKETFVDYKESKSKSGNPLSVLDDCDMFAPEPSERDGWLLKTRFIQPEGFDANVWERGHVLGRELSAIIRTGIEYDESFKMPHFIKALPELVVKHQIRVESNSYNIKGELCIIIYVHGNKIPLKQGMPIAEIVFP